MLIILLGASRTKTVRGCTIFTTKKFCIAGITFFILTILLFSVSHQALGQRYCGREGQFDQYYRKMLDGVDAPSPEAIEQVAESGWWIYPRPISKVWQACMYVISQYEGIIAMNSVNGSRSFLMLMGRETQAHAENRVRQATCGSFLEQWLAIAVIPISQHKTKICVAAQGPKTLLPSSPSAQTFFYHLHVHLFNTRTWLDKFASVDWSRRNPARIAESYHYNSMKNDKSARQDHLIGGWVSKRAETAMVFINCPEVETTLTEIVRRLKQAAGVSRFSSNVHIVSSPDLNAFAVPNGDLFVCSGLLDAMDTPDQLAAILAHELDHVLQRDVTGKIRASITGQQTAAGVRTAMAIGDFFVQLVPVAGLAASVVKNIGHGAVELAASKFASDIEKGLLSSYSAESERRADINGHLLLCAAGFASEAQRGMLTRLQAMQFEFKNRGDILVSNLVNMAPGLEERIKLAKELEKQHAHVK